MATVNLNTVLLVRRGTTEEWASGSYTLKAGELGFDTKLKLLKIGDGETSWAELAPVNKTEFAKAFATIEQGAKADSAIQGVKVGEKAFTIGENKVASVTAEELLEALGITPDEYLKEANLADYVKSTEIVTGKTEGTIKVKETEVKVHGLGSAAYTETGAYATATQGEKADSAVQKISIGEKEFTVKTGNATLAQDDLKEVAGVTALEGRVSQNETDITGLKATVKSLTGAMHFIGTSTADPVGESGPTIEGHEEFAAGDVCIFGEKEFVYDGSKWAEFGDTGSLATKDELEKAYLKKEEAESTYAKQADLTTEQKAREALGTRLTTAEGTLETTTSTATAAKATADAAMPKAGGTFEGKVTLSEGPTEDLDAATKKYVDDEIGKIHVSSDVNEAIEALKAELVNDDSEVEGSYVSAVKQTDGKITVERQELPKATVTNITQGTNITVSNDGTTFTVAHETIKTASIPTIDEEAKTSYFTSMTVNNGHVTKVTATNLADGLKALGTFIFDGGKADGTWGE